MKLTKEQLKDVRKKFKEERASENPDAEESYTVTKEDRRTIRHQKSAETISVRWNMKVGDLVYLPDSSVGLIVKVENFSGNKDSLDVSGLYKGSEKSAIVEAKHKARYYVVTPSGKTWYNPSRLKKIDS